VDWGLGCLMLRGGGREEGELINYSSSQTRPARGRGEREKADPTLGWDGTGG